MAHSCTPPFPLQEHICALENCSFATLFAPFKLAGLWHLRQITGEGQRYGSPKNGLSTVNHLAGEVRQKLRNGAA
jgi:hypothetical protein